MDSEHFHVITRESIRLYKNLDFIGCEICGRSLTEILAEEQAKQDCKDHKDTL